MSVRRYDTIVLGLLKKKKKKKKKEECQIAIFYFVWCIRKLRYYSDDIYTLILLEISCRPRWWCLKCVIVYLVWDIPAFVMYCVYGKSRSSLLIEYTDSNIYIRPANRPGFSGTIPEIQAVSRCPEFLFENPGFWRTGLRCKIFMRHAQM